MNEQDLRNCVGRVVQHTQVSYRCKAFSSHAWRCRYQVLSLENIQSNTSSIRRLSPGEGQRCDQRHTASSFSGFKVFTLALYKAVRQKALNWFSGCILPQIPGCYVSLDRVFPHSESQLPHVSSKHTAPSYSEYLLTSDSLIKGTSWPFWKTDHRLKCQS